MKVFILSSAGLEMKGFVATNDWLSTPDMGVIDVFAHGGEMQVCKNGSKREHTNIAFESEGERRAFREAALV